MGSSRHVDEFTLYCSSVCFWDIRAPRIIKPTEEKNLSGIPTTFKHLDLSWKPHLKVSLYVLCDKGLRVLNVYSVCNFTVLSFYITLVL